MDEIYVPAPCLADARRVLEAQDPDAARQAEQRWPGRMWRQAIRQAAATQRLDAGERAAAAL